MVKKTFPQQSFEPTSDLPQHLSYSKAVQRASDDTDRQRRECEERLLKLERASEAQDHQLENQKRPEESESGYVQHTRRRRESAKNRFGAIKSLHTALYTAAETALEEYSEKDLEKWFHSPVHAERIS